MVLNPKDGPVWTGPQLIQETVLAQPENIYTDFTFG